MLGLSKYSLILAFLSLINVSALTAAGTPGSRAHQNALESFNVLQTTEQLKPSTQLTANATTFRSGDWVSVQWSNVQDPALEDKVALYAEGIDPQATAPIKYVFAVQSATHISKGYGSFRFRLVNMRRPVRFALVRPAWSGQAVEAYSNTIHPVNANEPLQIHLALTANHGEMLAQWTTLNSNDAFVAWGKREGVYTESAPAEAQTYSRADMCGAPANSVGWADPGLLHYALMRGLQPDTQYFYVVGDQASGLSEEHSFRSPPDVGPDSSVKFLAIADLGQAEVDGSLEHTEMTASLNTTEHLALETDYQQLLVHNGDISYARGYQTIWDAYWDQLQGLTARMPYMAIPGNHERDWPGSGDRFPNDSQVIDSGGECGVSFERRVKMPLPGPDKFWYSFDYGPIHFLQYSTEHHFQPGSEQHDFMVKDLQGVNRSHTPWLIVGGHRPFIVDSNFERYPDGDLTVAADLQEALEEVFMQYQVDLTLHGHHHSYQRTCPFYRGKCLPSRQDGSQVAPIHLVMGHAGAGLSFTLQDRQPDAFEVVSVEHGYIRAFANSTHLDLEVIRSSNRTLMDTVQLHKLQGHSDWSLSPPQSQSDI